MRYKELKELSHEELKGNLATWQDELFRSRIKSHTSELKDTSQFGKLRKKISQTKFLLSLKAKSGASENAK